MNGLAQAQDLDPDSVADAIDRALAAHRRGVITALEAKESIQGTTSLYMRFAVAPAGDVGLVIDYARHAIEQLSLRSDVMDPVLVEHFEEWLRGQWVVDEIEQRLEVLLERLLAGATADDGGYADEELADLCRTGLQSHRLLLSLNVAAERILRCAHRAGCWRGLHDAVSPLQLHSGQIARHDRRPRDFRLAMDLLAHLAADPATGAPARGALLELAEHVEVAGEAVVRLPMHLLDDDDRARLLEIHERRVSLFCDDPLFVPLGVDLLRDNRLVRGAVWQAFDARHVR